MRLRGHRQALPCLGQAGCLYVHLSYARAHELVRSRRVAGILAHAAPDGAGRWGRRAAWLKTRGRMGTPVTRTHPLAMGTARQVALSRATSMRAELSVSAEVTTPMLRTDTDNCGRRGAERAAGGRQGQGAARQVRVMWLALRAAARHREVGPETWGCTGAWRQATPAGLAKQSALGTALRRFHFQDHSRTAPKGGQGVRAWTQCERRALGHSHTKGSCVLDPHRPVPLARAHLKHGTHNLEESR